MTIPQDTIIQNDIKTADFVDCYSIKMQYEGQSALAIYLVMVDKTPIWVDYLMALRNYIVSKLGLKNLGKLGDVTYKKPSSSYVEGDRVGIFSLSKLSHNEIILEDQDKHLNVKISLFIQPNGHQAEIFLTTVVHINNCLGRLYMLLIKPVHKIIVPAVLKQLLID